MWEEEAIKTDNNYTNERGRGGERERERGSEREVDLPTTIREN